MPRFQGTRHQGKEGDNETIGRSGAGSSPYDSKEMWVEHAPAARLHRGRVVENNQARAGW
jgi:hypothetical protein